MTITAAKVSELRNTSGAGMMDCKKALEATGGDMEAAMDYLRKKGISSAAKKADRETNEGGIGMAFSGDHKSAGLVHIACETDFVSRNDQFQALLKQMAGQVVAKGADNLDAQPMVDGQGTVGERIISQIATIGENIKIVKATRVAADYVGGYVHSNGRVGVLVALAADKAVPADQMETLSRDLAMHIAASNVLAIDPKEIDPAVVAKEKEIFTAQTRESGKPEAMIDKIVEGRMNKFFKESTLLSQAFVKNPDLTIEQVVKDAGKAAGAAISIKQFVKFQF